MRHEGGRVNEKNNIGPSREYAHPVPTCELCKRGYMSYPFYGLYSKRIRERENTMARLKSRPYFNPTSHVSNVMRTRRIHNSYLAGTAFLSTKRITLVHRSYRFSKYDLIRLNGCNSRFTVCPIGQRPATRSMHVNTSVQFVASRDRCQLISARSSTSEKMAVYRDQRRPSGKREPRRSPFVKRDAKRRRST